LSGSGAGIEARLGSSGFGGGASVKSAAGEQPSAVRATAETRRENVLKRIDDERRDPSGVRQGARRAKSFAHRGF
jgi:hypothetical protein